ncbi:MAG: membrane-anchored glycerophosphoryl diester phosphodiesterase (GDPDase) [Myxococcota bacterium]|jgi:membrane-anchored glycerophosphoryl diester phosphodiesterase (GDPDase)
MNSDEAINESMVPIAKVFSDVIFFSVNVGGTDLQLIVLWLYFLAPVVRKELDSYSARLESGEITPFAKKATAEDRTGG